MNVRKLTFSALLVAIGTITGHMVYIPVGVAKCFPMQHTINVISAVLLGPWYSLANAFLISLLRNILGTGSPLAFPGSMIGAAIASFAYLKSRNMYFAAAGEIAGTGIIGALLSFPMAYFIMGKQVGALFFIIPFTASTIGGSLIALAILKSAQFSGVFKSIKAAR
ncbi:energy coupling factor transporter S component ThiW [Peptoclostridium litorale DSM 5388]|uniref:ThiW protein n=1 Tax=Peptoclostridium litorale DSM 5388 TaxID=1121324 RepID=A0A069RGT6_PEPLI|nr:energy coupling factor transporter S component ThiW [Peptoclostridium litorale]KDR96244.1 ThiW protein [Peptoclostridium litorale DSM 5388]SIO14349.1 energy coupling factor transporter S component ThiW [Peptoclostridium litorale DSM 5388]